MGDRGDRQQIPLFVDVFSAMRVGGADSFWTANRHTFFTIFFLIPSLHTRLTHAHFKAVTATSGAKLFYDNNADANESSAPWHPLPVSAHRWRIADSRRPCPGAPWVQRDRR